MQHQPPSRPAEARAIAASAAPFRATAFFPRGPGPGLIVFALVIGIFPSVIATILIGGMGIDGGFYMSQDYIRGQHRLLLTIAGILTLCALTALVFVLHALRADRKDREARIVLVIALLATIAWDWTGIQAVRSMLTPMMSRMEVLALADHPYAARTIGARAFSLEDRTFRIEFDAPHGMTAQDVPGNEVAPVFCVQFGRLFAGPVDALRVRFTAPEQGPITLDIERDQCRAWYLTSRAPQRRPRPLPTLR